MISMFHDGSRELQDSFDTRRLADRIDQLLKHETIPPHDVLAADDPARDPSATVV